MTLKQAENAVFNGAVAAIFWLILDWAFILTSSNQADKPDPFSQPVLYIGTVVMVVCIVGLFYQSRLAAVVLLLFLVVPQVMKFVQGHYPSGVLFLLSLVFLYYFVNAVIGAFTCHKFRMEADEQTGSDE
ncbi:MAG: hypothetical protein GY731_15200 [Gammaproteobacteria bacterium]|nr:hypothetical protein [Gammaproteobacteria bacterium]